jgi:hypothetical protein
MSIENFRHSTAAAWNKIPLPIKKGVIEATLSFGASFILGCMVGGLEGGILAGTVGLVASVIYSVSVPLLKLIPNSNTANAEGPRWPWWAEIIRRVLIWGVAVGLTSLFMPFVFSSTTLIVGVVFTFIVAGVVILHNRKKPTQIPVAGHGLFLTT